MGEGFDERRLYWAEALMGGSFKLAEALVGGGFNRRRL